MKPHLLHFPCRNAVFDWFGEVSGSGVAPVSIALLAEQREFEGIPANRSKRITCHGCNNPAARFVVCLCRGQLTEKLYPRRFPNSKAKHKPGCYSYSEELLPAGGAPTTSDARIARANGDFAALKRPLADPEFSILAMRKRHPEESRPAPVVSARASDRLTIGLQRFAKEVLQRSGVCNWSPAFSGKRTPSVFNGLVKGALTDMMVSGTGPGNAILQGLPGVSFVPWSFLTPGDQKTPEGMTACVGFGFVERLGLENSHGARQLILSNYPACPVVIPRRILDREGRKPRSPLHTIWAHPTWVIFVAGLYDGVWKAHALVPFRLSDTALIPIESHHENAMAEHLVAEGRTFIRWLLPPGGILGKRFIPDFQLLDTPLCEYIEVAGMMDQFKYCAGMGLKLTAFNDRLLIWDTRFALNNFLLPPPTGTARPTFPVLSG